MREYGIEYDLNGRAVYEIFAVYSIQGLCATIDDIKAIGGYIAAIHCLN